MKCGALYSFAYTAHALVMKTAVMAGNNKVKSMCLGFGVRLKCHRQHRMYDMCIFSVCVRVPGEISLSLRCTV